MCESIWGRKLFLVLDDVWTEDSTLWEPFRLALQNAAQGSRILVTTRKSRVADIMGSAKRINLEELSDDDCWSIFSTIAFSDRDSKQRYWSHPFEFARGIGRLSSLTKQSHFSIGGKDDSQRCELGELKNLNHLQGTLKIYGLGNVVDACEAKNAELKKKIGLYDLDLYFSAENIKNYRGRIETDVSVLDALEQLSGLENLTIHLCSRTTIFPNWMVSLAKLKRLNLRFGSTLECLPPLGKLQFLEFLHISDIWLLEKTVKKLSMRKIDFLHEEVDNEEDDEEEFEEFKDVEEEFDEEEHV
nr:putative disease resistance rpp13-like protein 1 [Quercus suber]